MTKSVFTSNAFVCNIVNYYTAVLTMLSIMFKISPMLATANNFWFNYFNFPKGGGA